MTTDSDEGKGKASFHEIYNRPDPRAYMRTLRHLDYQIPEHGRLVFDYLARHACPRKDEDPFTVLDLCCSYGLNAALLNHHLTLADLYAHYCSSELDGLGREEVLAVDRDFYAGLRRSEVVPVVGVDVAANAVDYALDAGLLAAGSSQNLEEEDPSDQLKHQLADVGLITVTGGISYITERTFARVLGSARADRAPWIAVFALRWVDMGPYAEVLARYGLVLERFEGRTYRQRLFIDDAERDHVLSEVARLGFDTHGVETDGYHHTYLHVARPPEDVDAMPIDELLNQLPAV